MEPTQWAENTRVPESLRPVATDEVGEAPAPDGLRVEKFFGHWPVRLGFAIVGLLGAVTAMLIWVMRPLPITELPSVAPASPVMLSSSEEGLPDAMRGLPLDRRVFSMLAEQAVTDCAGYDELGSSIPVHVEIDTSGTVTAVKVGQEMSDRSRAACVERQLVGAQVPVGAATPRSFDHLVKMRAPNG